MFAPISREGALILNNLFLTAAAATVVIGTLYPLALEAVGGTRISVGAPFFSLTFIPLVVPLLILVPFGPLLAWKRGDVLAASQRLMAAFAVAVAAAIVVAMLQGSTDAFALFGVALGAWLIAGSISELAFRIKVGSAPVGESWRRLVGLRVRDHVELRIYRQHEAERSHPVRRLPIAARQSLAAAGTELSRDGGRLSVSLDGEKLSVMTPSKRNFTTRGASTTEAALLTRGVSQLYISLGDTPPPMAASPCASITSRWCS